MNLLRNLFGKGQSSPPQARGGYVCAACGNELAGADLAYAKKCEADAVYFYSETHKPGMSAKIIQVSDIRDKLFCCQACLDSVETWQEKDQHCVNCQSLLMNVVQMGSVPDVYCTARGNQAISDAPRDSCASWELGTPFKRTDQPVPVKPEVPNVALCGTCWKSIKDFHYSFESIVFARGVGCQCSSCGRVWCAKHAATDIPAPGNKCPQCGGSVVMMEEGPAKSSMVEAAQRDGKYTVHIRPPGSNRRVEVG